MSTTNRKISNELKEKLCVKSQQTWNPKNNNNNNNKTWCSIQMEFLNNVGRDEKCANLFSHFFYY